MVIEVGNRTNGGVYVTEQLPAERVHVAEEKDPPETLALKLTVPVGITCVPGPRSITVTVQVVLPRRTELGLHVTETETGLGST